MIAMRRWLNRLPRTALLFFIMSFFTLAAAHEGHDHSAPPPQLPQLEPRLALYSEQAELVAVAKAAQLWVYLDDYATNAPLAGARLTVSGGGRDLPATEVAPGLYRAPADWAGKPGEHELVFTIQGKAVNDLLIGVLKIPEKAAAAAPELPWRRYLPWAAGALVLILVVWLLTRRRPRAAVTLLAVGLLMQPGDPLRAHEGHDHAAEPAPAVVTPPADPEPAESGPGNLSPGNLSPGNLNPGGLVLQGVRQADGGVFLPKPAQRVLGIRSTLAVPGEYARTLTLTGTVAPDPNHSGMLQASQSGAIEPAGEGLPNIGAKVKKGEVLGYLRPSLGAVDRANQSSQLQDLKKDFYLAGRQKEILEKQLESFRDQAMPTTTNIQYETIKATYNSLKARIADLERGLSGRQELRAPLAGVVSATNLATGQVVAAGDTLLQIVDPDRLWVEVVSYDPAVAGQVEGATAVTASGERLNLSFQGQGYQLRDQALPIQFSIEGGGVPLAIGQPLQVFVQTRGRLAGSAVPQASVLQGGGGEQAVWVHDQPESFVRRRVEAQPLDGERSVILEGLAPRDRVVTDGAALLSQVR